MKRLLLLLALPVLFYFVPPASRVPAASARTAPAEIHYRLQAPDNRWVSRTMAKMSLRDKIAQLIHIRVNGRFLNRADPQFGVLADAVRRSHIGGVILFAGDVYESAWLLNDLQSLSELPLLVESDFERGASFRISDTTSFPWSMALGAAGSEDLCYREGAVTAREARALGVHWIFAPVMDVNNNPENPVINIRSYGEDPRLVARLGAAFIRGARDNGVLTTAKHFPGHGDTATDSHIGLAVVPADMPRLESVEMVPFRSAIDAGVDAIMTAHVAVPKVTGEADIPATLSPRILTGLLRGTLNFKGIVVTDALEMGGITGRYWTGLACVQALQAGADLLLLPQDTDVAINEVVRAVERGDLPPARIDESVSRVLQLKTRLGLHRQRTTPLERIPEIVASPASRQLAQEIADRSITLLKEDANVLPISPVNPPRIFSLVVSSDSDSNPGAVFQSELRRRFPAARTEGVDPRIPEDLAARIVRNAAEADVVICATLVRLGSSRGNLALPESQRTLLDRLVDLGKPVIWIAFGNPYLLRLYPQVSAYLCTFSYADVSQAAAARALAGEIAVSGKTPVSIPDYYAVGAGLQKPKLELVLRAPSSGSVKPDVFDETRKSLDSFVKSRAFPGAELAVGFRGTLVLDAVAGKLEYSAGSQAVTDDTIYDLASLSKVIGTTTAAMMLVDGGRLLLEAPVQDYLPEFQGPGKEKVRVLHLLQHTAGLPAWLPLYNEASGYEAFMKKLFAVPLEYEPGTRQQYSDLGMILLGEIVARAAGRPLDQYLNEKLFAPLGMQSTLYAPPPVLRRRIAPTEDDPWRRRTIRGEVHDENAYAMGGVSGHAGLFSTARDLAVFAQMMLFRGIYDHHRYFKPETLDRFTNPSATPTDRTALGWRKPADSSWTGRAFSVAAYGHTGFTGTSIWIDPERQLFIILLTNRVHPSRENNQINDARRVITESVLRAIEKIR
jgi:beta-N-acetylhexosaminidase